ncbi:MAG: hypothetical protein Ct9H300mP11_30860 [Chloroflexota bacterium]|nr:MAG: hypothetical protein Ct9H300mP11_30860 [Chloroflexota bacterium]
MDDTVITKSKMEYYEGLTYLPFLGRAHKAKIADPGPGRRFFFNCRGLCCSSGSQTVSKMSWVTTYGSQLALGRRSSI